MSESFSSEHAFLHHLYRTPGSSLAPAAKSLDIWAGAMLRRTGLARNLVRARTLRRILDDYVHAGADSKLVVPIHEVLSELHGVIVDDVLLLSAFEMHAKAVLLRRGYVVHEVPTQAGEWRKAQRKKPLHVRTIRAAVANGNSVPFLEKTIGVSQLLAPKYRAKYPLNSKALGGLKEVRGRRNLVHFQTGFAWSVSHGLIALVSHLERQLEGSL